LKPAAVSLLSPVVLAAAIIASVAPAAAAPPLPAMVIAVERPGATGSSDQVVALVSALADDGRIVLHQPDIPTKRVQACGRSVTWEGCIRRWLQKKRLNSLPVRLAVVADRRRGSEVRLVCIGPGRRWAHIPAHTAWVDLKMALAEPAGGPSRQRLAACLEAGAADRGL